MKGPAVLSVFHYASFTLALKSFLNQPGDGRMQPEVPASCLSWSLAPGAILRLNSANRKELGLVIDGTGAGRTLKTACPLCHPVEDTQGKLI